MAQFNPVVNTSIRGHGKWGDFLVALIPLSWCGNILVNSNFILRMIEWQNEGSLFTLRVQGKQWYWVYKFDATAAQNILSAPKNIGHNNWFVTNTNESYITNSYYSALQLGTQLEYKQLYFKLLSDDKLTKKVINRWHLLTNTIDFSTENKDDQVWLIDMLRSLKKFQPAEYYKNLLQINQNMLIKNHDEFNEAHPTYVPKVKTAVSGFYDFNLLDDTTDYASNLLESVKVKPLTFLNGVLNKHNIEVLKELSDENIKPILFVSKFWLNAGTLEPKVDDSELLWGFKQKKYKRLQKFKFLPRKIYDPDTLEPTQFTQPTPLTLRSNLMITSLADVSDDLKDRHWPASLLNPTLFNYHNAVKFNRQKGELVPVNLARRLLRTKRTLVLPAHVNITVITNSYDVVHSWFIPGLGLKLDCVPGRSTHHSFYIDNIGFYYGQCAEICGRYHHHMPIRLCALPFEQFLVWWQRRGVKRLHRIGIINKKQHINPNDIKFRYKW